MILDKLKENAQLYPDNTMYVCWTPDSKKTLLWKELDDFSDYLAFWLDECLPTNKPVIVYGHKDPMMLVSFFACVKSGRAYCPIDVNVPNSRVEAIVSEVNPDVVIATEALDIDCNIMDVTMIQEIIDKRKGVISPKKYVDADDTFYIIFTSGSTGIPKGVQITRDCLDNFIKWAVSLGSGQNNEQSVYINQAPFSFDLSVMDLYLCIFSGGVPMVPSKRCAR